MQIDEDLKEYDTEESEQDFCEELDEEELDEEEFDEEEPLAPSHQPIMVPLSQAILISGATGVSTLIFGLLLIALYMSMQRRTKATPATRESTEGKEHESK